MMNITPFFIGKSTNEMSESVRIFYMIQIHQEWWVNMVIEASREFSGLS